MTNPNIASRFDEIYNSTSRQTLALITAKCRDTADIADILQNTYLELYQALSRRGADFVVNEKAFVFRIARQKIFRYYSLAERMKNFISTNAADEDGEETGPLEFEADAFDLEDYAVGKALLEEARTFIQSKPEGTKKVFYLFYDVGLSIPEIAAMLSMSESNVKNKLYRTLTELRSLLNEG